MSAPRALPLVPAIAAFLLGGLLAAPAPVAHADDTSQFTDLHVYWEGRAAHGTSPCGTPDWGAELTGPARAAVEKDADDGKESPFSIGIRVSDAAEVLGEVRISDAYLTSHGVVRMFVGCDDLAALAAAGYGADARTLTFDVTDGTVTTSSGTFALAPSSSQASARQFRVLTPGRFQRSDGVIRVAGRLEAWGTTTDGFGWVPAADTQVEYTRKCRGEAKPVNRKVQTDATGAFTIVSSADPARVTFWMSLPQTDDRSAAGGSWVRRQGRWSGPFGDRACQRL
ncbi:hypothetical protein GCM10022215_41240 [Nocardioides fonticola]|uniref:Uncharacterized protein n=1 Tax=Nocardioides fonticola TaxID=450363 RepID=A0ABP7Y1G8_9ACTN